MKTKHALSAPSIEFIINILCKYMDQTAVNQAANEAETFLAAINDCLGMIKVKVQTETSVHFMNQYRDHVKVLIDQRNDLQTAIAENNSNLEALRKEINDLIG